MRAHLDMLYFEYYEAVKRREGMVKTKDFGSECHIQIHNAVIKELDKKIALLQNLIDSFLLCMTKEK